MFGLSFAEILVILLAFVIFVGPKDLPDFIRSLRNLYVRFKSMMQGVSREYEDVKKEIGIEELDIDAINGEVKEILGDDGQMHRVYSLDDLITKDDKDDKGSE